MTPLEQPVTEETLETPTIRRVLDRLMVMGVDPKVRLIALLVVGLAAWILTIVNFPLEDAIPRYADF
jgi:hypothetical protein